jgi:hypothetical protein
MNLRMLVIAGCFTLVGACFAMTLVTPAAQLTQETHEKGAAMLAPHWGRFQIASSNNNVFVADTVTGECWTATGGQWRRLGPPIATPKP